MIYINALVRIAVVLGMVISRLTHDGEGILFFGFLMIFSSLLDIYRVLLKKEIEK
jgi:hypothetical protein